MNVKCPLSIAVISLALTSSAERESFAGTVRRACPG